MEFIFPKSTESSGGAFALVEEVNETITISSNSTGNDTLLIGTHYNRKLKIFLDVLLLLTLIVIMLSMGCDINLKSLLDHVKKPVGLCIGLFGQFVIIPLTGFCLLLLSGISGVPATGVLLISCCPGGALSNIFTYFCEGDISLSVAMTSVSTAVGLGFMPANLWLYGRYFESEDLVIPYKKMVLSLVVLLVPVAVGMVVKWKLPRVAACITKIGSYFGLIFIFGCFSLEILVYPDMFASISAALYAVILCLPLAGLALGYALATLCRRTGPQRRAISIECGIQNVPLAITVITLSVPIEVQKEIVLLPWFHSFSVIVGSSAICLSYHFIFKPMEHRKKELKKAESKQNQDYDLSEKKSMLKGDEIKISPSNLSF